MAHSVLLIAISDSYAEIALSRGARPFLMLGERSAADDPPWSVVSCCTATFNASMFWCTMEDPVLKPLITFAFCVNFLVGAAIVQAEAPPASQPATQPDSAPPPPTAAGDKLSVTEHELAVNGQTLKYRATAGTLVLKDESGKPKADLFFIAYERLPRPQNIASRPVTFCFNGGPGAAAVWLHLGAVGPKRVRLNDNGDPPSPPYGLSDNPQTWLNFTDLVFIDPVGTGYSRAAAGEKAEQFYGVQEDIHWVGDFIRLYTTRYERWPSPKFLAGESYGTTRAAGLSSYLVDEYGIGLNGIVLISSVLSFQLIQPGGPNDLPYALYLPSYMAVARYHKKLAADLQSADFAELTHEVEGWTGQTYLPALTAGAALPADQRKSVIQAISRYTSLSADFIDRANLRIDPGAFEKELLAGERQVIGRFDGRITGFNPNTVSPYPPYDPSLSPYLAAYSGSFNDYVRRSLKFESDLQYEVLSGKVNPWNFGRGGSSALDVAGDLQEALLKNPSLKVMFASGYEDLATPFEIATYTIDHLTLSAELRGNIRHKFYEGGHMLYHYKPSLEKLSSDVHEFVDSSVPKGTPATTEPGR